MAGSISKKDGGFANINDIPARYKKFSLIYNDNLISDKLKNNVFAIIDSKTSSLGSDNATVLLLSYFDEKDAISSEIKPTLNKIINRFRANSNYQQYNLLVGPIQNTNLLKTIKDELSNKELSLSQGKPAEAGNHILIAEEILSRSMKLKASDLHIESDGERAVIKIRVHTEILELKTMTHPEAKSLANTFYGKFTRGEDEQEKGSGDGLYNHKNLLDGEFSRRFENFDMKARMVNIGLNYGEEFNMVLRLIDKTKANVAVPFHSVGFSKYACEELKFLQTASKGMVLVVGATGSGKSTSIQNFILHEIERCGGNRKIYSVEQPVEQKLAGVTQISAAQKKPDENTKADQDFSFDNINRALMRGDPDSIFYGEIRDSITATASIKGVESGHLVYGTLHVTDAIGVFPRFETFGIDPRKICKKSFIAGIVFQKLIPKLCPKCSIKYKVGDKIPLRYGEFHAIKTYKFHDGSSIDMSKVLDIKDGLGKNESIIRALQKELVISTYDVIKMLRNLEVMNEDSYDDSFRNRLDHLITTNQTQGEEHDVRFRGDGCKDCFNGNIGVVPAIEILKPDETFLDLIQAGRITKAENHWKSKLRGRTATQDTYEKILSGIVDPRIVEEELDKLGG